MIKNCYIKKIIFLIFFITVILALISASSAAVYEEKKKIDSGQKISKVNNEKYQIKWETEKVSYVDKIYVNINYQSMPNKKNKGYLLITLEKIGKNKMDIGKDTSEMIVGASQTINTNSNTQKYYLEKIRPNISHLIKNTILNKRTLEYFGVRYFNRTLYDPVINASEIMPIAMGWEVYYFSQTSSIEIIEKYTYLHNSSKNFTFRNDKSLQGQNLRIDKYCQGKLKITKYQVYHIMDCGPTIQYEYVKTDLSPKQYYLNTYKQKLERKKLT